MLLPVFSRTVLAALLASALALVAHERWHHRRIAAHTERLRVELARDRAERMIFHAGRVYGKHEIQEG